jgi:hypothetical protein
LARQEKLAEYLIVLGVVLLVAVPLVLLVRDVVRNMVVIPLLYILWVGRLLLQSVPQAFFWFVFLTAALVLAVGSLVRQERSRGEQPRVPVSSSGQVRAWVRRIRLMARGGFTGWYFGQHMERLIVDVLAHRERLTPKQIRHRVRSGDLEVPPEIRPYFRIARVRSRRRWIAGLVSRLRRRSGRRAQESPPAESGLERAVRFLEDQLEVGP